MVNRASLLKNRNHLILLSGQIISEFGSSITQLAYPLLFLSITGSPVEAGFSVAANTLPTFLFGIPAGTLIDLYDRKKLMVICDAIRFLILGSIPLLLHAGHISIDYLYVSAFISGTCDVIFSTAEQTAVMHIVEKQDLTAAYGQYEAATNTSGLLAPTLSGALYQVAQGLPFLVDAITYAVSVVSFFFITADFQDKIPRRQFSFTDTLKGAQWLWRKAEIRTVSLVRVVGALVSGGQSLIIILLAKQMGATPTLIGVVFSIGSIGVVLGSFYSHQIQKYFNSSKALIISRWAIACSFLLQLLSHNIVSLGIVLALTFGTVAVYGTIATSYRLNKTPDELQGRVNAFHRMIVFGGYTLGGALTGVLISRLSLSTTIIIFTLILCVLAAYISTQSLES